MPFSHPRAMPDPEHGEMWDLTHRPTLASVKRAEVTTNICTCFVCFKAQGLGFYPLKTTTNSSRRTTQPCL